MTKHSLTISFKTYKSEVFNVNPSVLKCVMFWL